MKNKPIIFLIIGFLLGSIPLLAVSFADDESLIPSWIKNTAKFWVEGSVSDKEFLNALEFLIKEGMLVIPETETLEEVTEQVEDTVFTGKIINCNQFGTDSRKIDFWVQSNYEKTVDLELVAMGFAENGEIVSLNVFRIYDLEPGLKKYDTTYINDDPRINSCSVKFQDSRLSK